MKVLSIVSICLTSLLLLLYPFVLVADIMAIAALPAGGGTPPETKAVITGFVWLSALYPLPYLAGLIGSIWSLKKGNLKWAVIWQGGIWAYLVLFVGIFLSALY